MTREVRTTSRELMKLGHDRHDAERFSESIHSVAKLLQIQNEIATSVHTGCEEELNAVGDSLIALAEAIAKRIGAGIELCGDPRGVPIRLLHEKLPRNGWADGYCIIGAMPWEEE